VGWKGGLGVTQAGRDTSKRTWVCELPGWACTSRVEGSLSRRGCAVQHPHPAKSGKGGTTPLLQTVDCDVGRRCADVKRLTACGAGPCENTQIGSPPSVDDQRGTRRSRAPGDRGSKMNEGKFQCREEQSRNRTKRQLNDRPKQKMPQIEKLHPSNKI